MERLREEVYTIVGPTNHPSREQIRKMTYLAMIIKEKYILSSTIGLDCTYALQVSEFTHQSP